MTFFANPAGILKGLADMPWRKDGSYILDDTELIPPDLRTPADRARIRNLNSPEQRALDKKIGEDFRASRGIFARTVKRNRNRSRRGKI